MAKTIMIQGTASNAGKSILCAGLCRIFTQDGYKVAPFKSQNMALNSAITADGLEMGRAQVVQAQAAGVKPTADMNPILLKPTGDCGSQVIVHGVPQGTMTARDYYAYKHQLVPAVQDSFARLCQDYDIVVVEGAGSPAEINLQDDDFVNMGLAEMTNTPVLLCGDIDRGGVFASLYGTVKLLPQRHQDLIKGLLINKFRGDVEILRSGLGMIEELTDKSVLGVIPMLDVDIDDEDSLSTRLHDKQSVGLLDVAVIRLPRLSNFTDFNPLERYAELTLRYVNDARSLGNPDVIILPGTKNTMADLLWLKESGLADKITAYANAGGGVIGICGGYQMLGRTLSDPAGVEGGGTMTGLGLLDVDTVFYSEKTRTQVSGALQNLQGMFAPMNGADLQGYEIHMGDTTPITAPLAVLKTQTGDVKLDGVSQGNVWGSYIHGLFDKGAVSSALVESLLAKRGLTAQLAVMDWDDYANEQYDRLADGMRQALDMKQIYKILEQGV